MSTSYENILNASIQGLIYDCNDPEALAHFYGALLGGAVHADPYCGYNLKTSVLPFDMSFQLDEDYTRPLWPGKKGDQLQMIHIDIKVADKEIAKSYALSLGAALPDEQFCQADWDIQWVTLLDPAGHPFCLFEE